MFGVEEKWDHFEITNKSHTSWLGDHKFSDYIVSMQEGNGGWILALFSDNVLLKVNARNAVGHKMFQILDHRSGQDTNSDIASSFSGEVHVEKSQPLVC